MTAPFKTFRGLRKSITPRWQTESEGGLVGYALDLMRDALLQRVFLGHLARFPQQDANGTPGPTDALNAMGRDRGVIRGIDEPDRSYAARLKDWLTDARTRGTAFTLMKTLHAYVDWDGSKGCSFRVVDNRGNWFSRAADGTQTSSLNTGNWNWDGNTAKWSRFWVIVYPGTRWAPSPYDWGDTSGPGWGESTGTVGSTMTLEQVQTLRAIVADQKPEGTRCDHIILAFDPASFNPAAPEPDGLWGRWSKIVAGVRVPSRLSTARYLKGS